MSPKPTYSEAIAQPGTNPVEAIVLSGTYDDGTPFDVPTTVTGRDAFNRVRIANPVTIFDSQLQYDLQPLLWESVLTGNGGVTHLPNESAARLRCTTTSGDKVVRQTHAYHRYQPGKSQLLLMTAVIGAAKANVRKRLGYFDAQNGLFLEQTSSGLSVVQRSYASGAAVDTVRAAQADWNIDPMDGTGPSGHTLNPATAQILVIDLEWLGVGSTRFGFVIDGDVHYVHQFRNANSLSTVYMTTANLPARYEIENTAAAASNTDLIQICTAVISEGGFEDDRAFTFAAANGITAISVTTRRPVLSIRPKATFNSVVNRGRIIPATAELTAATNNSYYELVYGGTLTNASFASVGTSSLAEFDVAATAISGGIVVDNGYVIAGSGTVRGLAANTLLSKLDLTLDSAGANPDNLTVVCTSFTGTSSVTAALNWKELR